MRSFGIEAIADTERAQFARFGAGLLFMRSLARLVFLRGVAAPDFPDIWVFRAAWVTRAGDRQWDLGELAAGGRLWLRSRPTR